MGLENKFVPPRIPESAWWIIRDQFIKSMPNQVTATYISSLLDASDTYAKFILSFLKKVSLLDESSNPTNLTQQWCDDKTYPDVCQQILQIYPEELRRLADVQKLDKREIERIFSMYFYVGNAVSKQYTSFYLLLLDAKPKPSTYKIAQKLERRAIKAYESAVIHSQKLIPLPESGLPRLEQVVTDTKLYNLIKKLFQDGHHAYAIEEAFKFLNNLVKNISNMPDLDGSSLMTTVFSPTKPVLKLNGMQSQSEKNEQQGYMQIFSGVMTGIRNPRAHESEWEDSEERALQLLSLANHLVIRVRNSVKNTDKID